MCLTGYQRQDRDDVMTMVGLMGAQFSKPLVAHKVTHLICYKFEGDKYDLAKRLRTMKLVNHRWLEDSLREWTLLPESNYNMSGYDMETFEAEAKDSEDESDSGITKHFARRNTKSPNTMKFGLHSTSELSNTSPAAKTLDDRANIVDPKSMSTVPTTYSKFIPSGKFDKHDAIGVPTCQEADVFSNSWCSVPSDMNIKTSESEKQKVKNEAVSPQLNAAKSPKLCATSYSRKTPLKSPLPLFSGEKLDKAVVSSKMAVGEIKDNIGVDAAFTKIEQVKDATFSGYEQNSLRGTDLFGTGDSNARLPLNMISDVSYDVSPSHKMSVDTKSCTVNNLFIDENILGLEMKSVSLDNDKSSECHATNLQNSRVITDTFNTMKKPLTCDSPYSKSILSPTEDVAEDGKKTPRTSFQVSEKDISPDKPDKLNHYYEIAGDVVGKPEETDKQQNGVLATSESDRGTKANKSASPTHLKISTVQKNDSQSKQHRIKMFAKKSLGSRPKLGSANRKGSILSNKTSSLNDSVSSSCGNDEKFFSSSPKTVNTGVKKVAEATDMGDIFHKYEAMDEDDKTVDQENKEADFEQMIDDENYKEVRLTSDVDKLAKETASGVKSNSKSSVLDDTIPSGIIKEVIEPGEPVSIRNIQLDELRVEDDEKSKLDAGDRGPMEETTLIDPSKMKSKHGKVGKAPRKKVETKGKKKSQLVAAGPNTEVHTTPDYKSEKENEPCDEGDKTGDLVNHCLDKPTVKSNTKQRKTTKKSREISANSSMAVEEVLREVKPEPVCFILSGHRLERKELQKVIKHLKGRVCRDSHQWSYQATHFITPDPVRRTEKFFAAAASGRWILKSDYLTDSSQAGKLLKEEPYEWYKNGLTEDGAINLEAPRKWRLLREKTGHGAFYGMHIIIYGECIAPRLDTLKRAVKAGDGTILATSPPYTRFLKSRVDFAVVSPGMPRADMWVQEFLNDEIPCVAADYLVEYVCKPGYPLDKHVLYNTHAWAEQSFSNLQRRAEEVSVDLSPRDDCSSDNDIACQECGSRDRGEVMLICGNEDGSNGCGIGMHIDCCNPPLLDIPEGDWFCSDCISSRNSNNSPNKRKKGVSAKRK
ncbi:BRCT domain-containing protein At4g02110 isoform X2 [Momordica charantia]|nr:BRCT domain-containing protein At4g02110 isoform X2 [Momordica charantia]